MLLQVAAGLPLDVAWLADGRAVTLSLGVGPVGGLETFAYAYDPVPPGNGRAAARNAADPALAALALAGRPAAGLRRQNLGRSTLKGTCGTGPLTIVGSGWLYSELLSSATQTTGFELQGIYLGIAPPGCTMAAFLSARQRIKPARNSLPGCISARSVRTPQLLAAAEPDYVSDQSDKLLWSTSYALSPDESLVAWTENDVEAGRGRVNLTPLDGGRRRSCSRPPR